MNLQVKRYRGKYEYSYTLGMAPTVELILHKPEFIYKIYIHSQYRGEEGTLHIIDFCKERGIAYEESDTVINRVANKGNIYVLGVFYKYPQTLLPHCPHTVLVNPSNSGNMGTILRTGLGFGINNVAVVSPGVDVFHPSVVRASMGALFSAAVEYFDTIEDYLERYPQQKLYSFLLEGENSLKQTTLPEDTSYSLVFGNEATGLPKEYLSYGSSVYIEHSKAIDSLNLSIAFGIAAYYFDNQR